MCYMARGICCLHVKIVLGILQRDPLKTPRYMKRDPSARRYLHVKTDRDVSKRDPQKKPIHMERDQYLRVFARSLFYVWSEVCVTWLQVRVTYISI